MNVKRILISFLISIFCFFISICPVRWIQSRTFGYTFDKGHSFILNYSDSDSVLGLEKLFSQIHPFFLTFSFHADEWGKGGEESTLGWEGWPELERGFSFSRRNYSEKHPLSSSVRPQKIDYRKASLIAGVNVVAITAGFSEAINSWGKSKSKFHVKDDWRGDGLAQTDELSHLVWGYKMTQFLGWAYDWVGFSPKTSRILSVGESSLILTLVEYPIDAYNPKQGLGISDLIFDYLGVGMAVVKKHCSWLNDFDFKLSWEKNIFSENQTIFAQTYEEFDNFIYWLTYRTKLLFPKKLVCFGFGYSAARSGNESFKVNLQGKPRREFYAGIGLSIPDLASLFGKRVGDFSKFLEILYPNIHVKL